MLSTKPEPADSGPTRPWPADQVERWPIERLRPYANNPRLHSEADLSKIAASIVKWGWTMPVLVDEHGVPVAGHARVAAAIILKLKSIPGNCYKGLERGGEACLSAGRQSTGGARELGPRSAA